MKTALSRALDRWHRYPVYLYSPRRFVYRLTGDLTVAHTRLPWRLPMTFEPGSVVGEQLVRTGVHDLVLSEALYRLTDPGDVCVDVGANIGYTAGLLASRAAPTGRVVCYEPAPDVFELLTRNVRAWEGAGLAEVEIRQVALSNVAAQLTLTTPPDYGGDVGGRTLERVAGGLESIPVQTSTLATENFERIDVLKIDVEGHELAVLLGAKQLIDEQRVRDVVFEHHCQPPTELTRRLGRAGYEVFRLEQGLVGPRLKSDIERHFAVLWDAPNYLATIEPERAADRLRRPGWRCLRPRLRSRKIRSARLAHRSDSSSPRR